MRIAKVFLLAGDLAALYDFYATALQLPVQEATNKTLALEVGRSQLVFEPSSANWDGFYHFAFDIPENQFGEAKTWLSQHVPLISDAGGEDEFDFVAWNAHAMYFYDPAGNIVELIARHDLANGSERSFGGHSLLGISEIGLATDDVAGTASLLGSRLGVGVFRGSQEETFTALGDDHGLLIVVKQGRTWFPDTAKEAGLYPVTVLASTDDGETHCISGPPYRITRQSDP
jgi:catechol-2,3-dioxygenase